MDGGRRDYYEILGVLRGSTSADITKAYKLKALKHHPDKNPGPESHSAFIAVCEAYAVLCNQERKRQYDDILEQEKTKDAREKEQTEKRRQMKESLISREQAHKKQKEDQKGPRSERERTHIESGGKHAGHRTIRIRLSKHSGLSQEEALQIFKQYGNILYMNCEDNLVTMTFEHVSSIESLIRSKWNHIATIEHGVTPEASRRGKELRESSEDNLEEYEKKHSDDLKSISKSSYFLSRFVGE